MLHNNEKWILAPAYDLLNVAILDPDDTEELALTIEGKKKKLKWEHFERLGKNLDLNDKQIKGIAKRFKKNKYTAHQWIKHSFLSKEYKEKYQALLDERYHILFGSI